MYEANPDPAVLGLVLDAVYNLVVRVLGDDEDDVDAATIRTALEISRQVQIIPNSQMTRPTRLAPHPFPRARATIQ